MSEDDPIIEDWWDVSQIELVTDQNIAWIRKTFQSTSGFWIKTDYGKMLGKTSQHEEIPPDAIIDETAWDHEHCSLCWETISDKGDYQREGFTNGDDWICLECYGKYILPGRKKSQGPPQHHPEGS